jgi:hypothetical protein
MELDSAARMRAILCASIFVEWREGGSTHRVRPGTGCRLAHTRATMGRLIAGLNVHMFQQDESRKTKKDYPAVYPPDSIPLGGFFTRSPSPPDGGPSGSGGAGSTTAPRAATAAARSLAAPVSDGGGAVDGPPRRRSHRHPSGEQPWARAPGGLRRWSAGPAAAPLATDAAELGSPAPTAGDRGADDGLPCRLPHGAGSRPWP